MPARLNLDELKKEYIGKIFGWLTVLDVIRTDAGAYLFRCKCKCGALKDVDKKHVLHGSIKSCGCYQKSKEKADKYSKWCKENPDKVKAKTEKAKEYFKEHPDQLIEQGKSHSEWIKSNDSERYRLANWHKENPELSAKASAKRSQWSKDHPDLQKKINEKVSKAITDDERKSRSERRRRFYIERPDDAAEMNKRISETVKQFWKDNPDVMANITQKRALLLKENPEIIAGISESVKQAFAKKRSEIDFSGIIDIIHPDYVSDLLSGNIKCDSKVMTKCPRCNNYETHPFGAIFSLRQSAIRSELLCKKCAYSITSSKAEGEIAEYISSFYKGDCVRNIRSIIPPQELDLYYPEKKIAIEFNGDYWHDENHKPKDYHYNKFKACLEKGILLVSIFEHDWNTRKDVIKQYLIDLFNGTENCLSFVNEKYVNNNYPLPNMCDKSLLSVISNSYIYDKDDVKVFTCGYSEVGDKQWELFKEKIKSYKDSVIKVTIV